MPDRDTFSCSLSTRDQACTLAKQADIKREEGAGLLYPFENRFAFLHKGDKRFQNVIEKCFFSAMRFFDTNEKHSINGKHLTNF